MTTNELGYTYNEVMQAIEMNLQINYKKLHGSEQIKRRKPKSNAYRIDRGNAQMRHR